MYMRSRDIDLNFKHFPILDTIYDGLKPFTKLWLLNLKIYVHI